MVKRLYKIPLAKPKAAGVSSAVLKRLRAQTRQDVYKHQKIGGIATIILRGGSRVFAQTAGWANRARGQRFSLRTLCRLHGATRPLVVAAFLTLVDEGKVTLEDPVAKHMPFSEEVMLRGSEGQTRKVRRRPTVRHLLTMTAGLKYQDCPAYKSIMTRVEHGKITTLAALCESLAKVPLQMEPGKKHDYGFCTDVVGRLCEVISGQSLEMFVAQRLLEPLGMKDTHFRLPSSKRSHVATIYACHDTTPAQRRQGQPDHVMKPFVEYGAVAKGIMSAGGGVLSYLEPGMWSTAQDYARFCQMIMDGGVAPGGKRILQAGTCKSLWTDGLAPYARSGGGVPGWNDFDPSQAAFWDRHTWSLLNTTLEVGRPKKSGPPRRGRSMWMFGGAGTGWAVDLKRKLVALTFGQNLGGAIWERSDGTGCYCLELARAAVDEGGRTQRRQ